MNILIVHNQYQIPGGEDVVADNEAQMLRRHGHMVYEYRRNNGELEKAGKIKKLAYLGMSFWSPVTWRDIRRIIREKKIDIVHVHNTLHLISPSVYDACFSMGVPVVQTMHNFRMLCPAGTFHEGGHICEDCVKRGYACGIKKGCYRGSRLQTAAVAMSLWLQRIRGCWRRVNYICLTEFNRKKLLTLNQRFTRISEAQVYVKPNYVPDFSSEKRAVGDYYVAAGRLERIKGTIPIVKAFARNGRTLYLAGQGELEDKIREYIRRKKLTNIHLTGQLEHDEVMKLICGAKALAIMPQWYETFGMTVAEAYSVKTPVISNTIGNAASLVEDGITGVKCNNSPEALNTAIERFERMDREVLGDNGYQKYLREFSEQSNYRRLMEIYLDCINRSKRRI